MPLQPHPYAYKTRMSAKRAPYLRPYSPPPLHLIDVVLRCAHRTTIYFGIDRFAFKFAIEDVLADAYGVCGVGSCMLCVERILLIESGALVWRA